MNYQEILQVEALEQFLVIQEGDYIFESGKQLYLKDSVYKIEQVNDSAYFCYVLDKSGKRYLVNLILRGKNIQRSCTCSFSGPICKHIYAAVFQLKDKLQKQQRNRVHHVEFTITKLDIENFAIEDTADEKSLKIAEKLVKNDQLKLNENAGKEHFSFSILDNRAIEVNFRLKKHAKKVEAFCSCGQMQNCEYITAALYFLKNKYGSRALYQLFEIDKQKPELLIKAKIDPEDPIVDELEVVLNDDFEAELVYQNQPLADISKFENFFSGWHSDEDSLESKETARYDHTLTFAVYANDWLPEIIPLIGKFSANKSKLIGKMTEIDDIYAISEKFEHLLTPETRQFIAQAIHLRKQKQLNERKNLTEENINFQFNYEYYQDFKELINKLRDQWLQIFIEPYFAGDDIKATELVDLELQNDDLKAEVIINEKENALAFQLRCYKQSSNETIPVKSFPKHHYIPIKNKQFIGWNSYRDYSLFEQFDFDDHREQYFSKYSNNTKIENLLQEINKKSTLRMASKSKTISIMPVAKIYLSESDPFLIISPVVAYDEYEFVADGNVEKSVIRKGGKLMELKRDISFEKELRLFIASLHPNFKADSFLDYFYIHQNEVLRNFWFMDFYQRCQEKDFEIYGLKELNAVKYNPNRPKISYTVKSGINWFDMDFEISYGEQTVDLKDLRKAFINKQHYVKLNDGSLGVLPEEWFKKFSLALEMGKVNDKSLRLPKTHFLMIERFYQDQLQKEESLQLELAEKKKLLYTFDKIEDVSVPQNINVDLRDYQLGGLNWFNFLEQFEWGGCLADDMGLGKTLQMLAFFQRLKEEKPKEGHKFLVVCPTTLIFNWQNEIEKFCPDLSFTVHWGIGRPNSTDAWQASDIVLTSYGTLVNDIELFKSFIFTVAVLDESQAIKNPGSLRYKACMVLEAKHRFVLTGTPVENNTVELYAQMNFVNPGLLGSLNSFKNNFAIAVDKLEDQEKLSQLRDILKPFILRRTKEQVAKELPEKTEMVLYCEMEKEQRQIYNTFRDNIREFLVEKIATDGLENSKMNILDGILKLRQICDSPALLNTEEYYGDASIKADELLRHVEEKTGKHKILIFSQFVKMLSIIKQKLEGHKIKYAYIDGKTKDRGAQVKQFQEDEETRIFLISLKAGGVGLNLTAADYVYLVDPWWNPAVEQQAIDRAHRIGQDKHVFAYKMICKDTIEDKILTLQKRKKALADELIASESSFMKQLSQDDIKELFS